MKNLNKKILIMFLLGTSLLFATEQGATEGMLSLMLGSFVAGLLLTFTPCVLPMVPILSSIIVGQGKEVSMKRSVSLSVAYVLGTAFSYMIMGALAGATGEQLQSYFQNVWAIGTMSLIFALMALSMFGLFNLQLPSFIQSRLNKSSNNIKGGSLPMVFVLGAVSALILGACVSPVLISFLGVAIAKGDAVLGAGMMLFMALGMGVPLILLGFGAGKFLPKAGGWMDNVKYLFGVLLLAVSIYLFSELNFVSPLLLWGIYLIVLAVVFGALESLQEASVWQRLLKSLTILALIWGTILLIGVARGSNDLAKPLFSEPIVIEGVSSGKKKGFQNAPTLQAIKSLRTQARLENKPLLLFVHSKYCGVCRHFKATTLKDEKVKEELSSTYLFAMVDITNRNDTNIQEIRKKYNVFGTPAFLFFDTEGEWLEDETFYGYQEAGEFLDTLELMAD